jgi:hypothetical protein
MQKTWNLTYYNDGEPVSERSGVSDQEAIVELYRLARGDAPVAPVELKRTAPAETGELSLAA